MQLEFTKDYILNNKGCYSIKQVEALKCLEKGKTTIKELFDELPIKDFCWFLVKKCDLTLKQKRLFSLHCAKSVAHIYNEKYLDDNRVNDCIEATEKYINNEISLDELIDFRRAADAAAAAAAAAAYAAAAYAAAAAAYAAAAAAYAAAAYAAAAYAAAAYADADDAYRENIWLFVESLINESCN